MDNKTKCLYVAIAILLASNGYLLYRLGNAEGKTEPVAGSNEEAKAPIGKLITSSPNVLSWDGTTENPVKELTAEELIEVIILGHPNTNKANGTAENSVEAPTLEEWVIGTYEVDAIKMVLLENGACESFLSGKKVDDAKWKTVDGEIHFINEGGISIARINLNGSLTEIAKNP